LLFSGDVRIDIRFVRVIVSQRGVNLRKAKRGTVGGDLSRLKTMVALDRNRSHTNARSRDDRPAAPQRGIARNQSTYLCENSTH